MTEHRDVERAREAEREVERARAEDKPLARDVLEKFMLLFASLASRYQPGATAAPNKFADNAQFRFWSERAVDAAKALAIYQSPRLQALAVAAPAPTDQKTIRFKLNVFENDRRVGVDFQNMTDDELLRYYRSRIAEGPGSAPASIEHDAGDKSPVHGEQVIPSLQSPAAAAENAPEPQPEPAAPSQPAEAPIEAPVSEPVVAPPNVVPMRPPSPPSEPPRSVQEHARSLASSIGEDGRPRCISPPHAAALSRAAMPRRSGVFDRWK